MAKELTSTTYGTELTSGSESDTDFRSTSAAESSYDALETSVTATEVQSHAILGAEQSAFNLSGDMNTSSSAAAAASTVTFQTPSADTTVTFRRPSEDATQLLNPPTVKEIDDEIAERRKISIAWLIVFGSITSVFCFPFGIFGLIFAG
jgi:hypothetical protein